jgi:hypothetical protein
MGINFGSAKDPDGGFCDCVTAIGAQFRFCAGAGESIASRNLSCRESEHFVGRSATTHRGETKIRVPAKNRCDRLIINGGFVGID